VEVAADALAVAGERQLLADPAQLLLGMRSSMSPGGVTAISGKAIPSSCSRNQPSCRVPPSLTYRNSRVLPSTM
jgi:hypothetical protein